MASCTASRASSRWRRPASAKRNARVAMPERKLSSVRASSASTEEAVGDSIAVVRDVANSLKLDPKRFLLPLSYVAVLGGCCTLIGTSTNLLVDDMARTSGQAPFGIFEITPVGLVVAVVGGLYLLLVVPSKLLSHCEDGGGDIRSVGVGQRSSHEHHSY